LPEGYPDLAALDLHFELALGRPPRRSELGEVDGAVVVLMLADGLSITELHQQVATLAKLTREAELPPKIGLFGLVFARPCPAERLEALRTHGRFGLLAHLWGRVVLVDLETGQLAPLASPRGDGTVASSSLISRAAVTLKGVLRQQADGRLVDSSGAPAPQSERQQETLFVRRLMRAPLVTMALLLTNLAVWLALELSGGSEVPMVLERFGAQVNALVRAGEVWRLVSACFLHIGSMHLAFNALVLFFFGRACENIFGRGPFLLLYVVSGAAGALATLVLLDPALTSAGASGAIFGLLGAQLVFGLRYRAAIPGRFKFTFLISAAGWTLLFVLTGLRLQSVNNAAHIGGLIGGVICALALRPRIFEATVSRAGRRWDLTLGLLAGAVLLATTALAGRYALVEGARPLQLRDGGHLFYKAPVSAGEAARLGTYLKGLGFAGGPIELRKEAGTYVLRMMVRRGIEQDQDVLLSLQRLIFEVSRQAFPGATVRVDLCDSLFTAFEQVELLPALGPGLGPPIEEAADKEATLAAYQAAARAYPRSAMALNNLAWGYAQLGRKLDEALALARRSAELKPTAEVLDTLAYVHLQRGELDEAERQIKRAIVKDPKAKVFKDRLAEIQKKKRAVAPAR